MQVVTHSMERVIVTVAYLAAFVAIVLDIGQVPHTLQALVVGGFVAGLGALVTAWFASHSVSQNSSGGKS